MSGLKSWMLWFGWFIHAFSVNIVSVIVIVFLMKVPLWSASYPPIEYCNWTIFAVFLLLYCAASIAFCFMISSIFNNREYCLFIFQVQLSLLNNWCSAKILRLSWQTDWLDFCVHCNQSEKLFKVSKIVGLQPQFDILKMFS